MTQHFPINLFVKFGPKYPGKIMILLREEKKYVCNKEHCSANNVPAEGGYV